MGRRLLLGKANLRGGGSPCLAQVHRAIIARSRLAMEFPQAESLGIAKRLGTCPAAQVREAYLQAFQRPAVETLARTGGRWGPPAYGLTLTRD